MSINSSVLTTVGLSPAALMYHRDIRTPFLATLPVVTPSMNDTLSGMMETMRTTDQLIEVNTQKSFVATDKSYNVKATVPNYKAGQRVLLYDENVPTGQMRKLHRFYRTVIIKECLPYWCYRVQDEKTGRIFPFKIHASRLKLLNVETHPECDDSVRSADQTVNPDTLSPQSQATQAEDRPPPAPPPSPQQTGPARQQGPPESKWHSIKGVTARRRRYRGAPYEYKVVWYDDSSSWLLARDITPVAIKAYQSRHSKRRRQC